MWGMGKKGGNNHGVKREGDGRVELGADLLRQVVLQRRREPLLEELCGIWHHADDTKMGFA
jgi:hypothetical protein